MSGADTLSAADTAADGVGGAPDTAPDTSPASAVLDALPDGVITLAESGDIRSANPAARTLFAGRLQGAVVGTDVRRLLRARDAPGLLEAVQTAARGDAETPVTSEVGVLDSTGGAFPVQATVAAMPDAGGGVALVVLRDHRRQKALEEAVDHLHHTCQVTGLSHRDRFLGRVRAALSAAAHHGGTGLPVAVLALGLDGLPMLAERLGGEADLEALRLVAERLRAATDLPSSVGRLGTTTFGVLLFPPTPDADAARTATAAIQRYLDQPVSVRGTRIMAQWRLGLAAPPGEHERERITAEVLVERAEMAMAESPVGRAADSLTVYAPAMEQAVGRRRQIEADLRAGIDPDQLRLLLQPQINVTTGRVVGAEALVRWQHPTHGWISPAQFIPLAEETGAILDIGDWVLDEACRLLAHWDREGLPAIRLAVNVSARQIQESPLAERVRDAIARHRVDAARLELEVTESMLLGEQESILNTLNELKALGVRLAIDDFGTGYSSLAYLRRYPMDTLKVDRAFVNELEHRPEDRFIVSSVVALARGLNMEIVAEGVEEEGQRSVLATDGCDLFQGFLVARPGSYSDLAHLTASRDRRPATPVRPPGSRRRRLPKPLPWRDSMRIGLDDVDADHKDLVQTVNAFLDSLHKSADTNAQRAGLAAILEHARAHFAREETIMANINYPHLARHRERHHRLLADFEAFLDNDPLDEDADGAVVAANYVKYWFAHHLMNEDRSLITYLREGR